MSYIHLYIKYFIVFVVNNITMGEHFSTNNRTRYILQWYCSADYNIFRSDKGTTPFVKDNCSHVNCYFTQNRSLLTSITEFDAIVFNFPGLDMNPKNLPQSRSPHQKYVFATMESAHNYPICDTAYDNFFNWTWTYRLDSDAVWGYMTIYDTKGKAVGPKAEMYWIADMGPINDTIKSQLDSKTKVVAWFVSNCKTLGLRESIGRAVSKYLANYGLTLDVYGRCGNLTCPRNITKNCLKMLEEEYYFYLAFENSFSEDYVTEKLLHALMHYTVPVVYGGANYTRFIPNGAYLDARALGARKLTEIMYQSIKYPKKYDKFFIYNNYYRYAPKRNYCEICALLNDKERVENRSAYKITSWWNNKDYKCRKVTRNNTH